jgi:hypothetical protein
MLSKFDAYVPGLWFEEGALISRDYASLADEAEVTEAGEKRMNHWTDAVDVAVGDTVAVNRLVVSTPPTDSVLRDYRAAGEDWPGAKFPQHSASSMNEEFAKLFTDFRSGVRLINNEQLRAKAKAASALRHKQPDAKSWAKKLADDVKDADD